MPQLLAPTARDLHVDVPLTNVSIGYRNNAYIADQVFPICPVQKQSDIYVKYNQSMWFRDLARLRNGGSKSEGSGFTVDNTNVYYCPRYSFRFEIADEVRDNADEPYNLDRDASYFVTDKMQLRREVSFSTSNFKTGVWGTDKTGGSDFTVWSDYGGSQPLVDITTYGDIVEGSIAQSPTRLVIGKQSYSSLKWHPDLIDTIKYTQRGQLTPDLIASLFELPAGGLLIGRSIYTTTADGTAEASITYTRVFGKSALLLYVPSGPSIMTPSAGYTFVWNRVAGATQYIKRMRDEEREIDIIEGNSYFTQVVTAKTAGVFLSGVTA